MIEPMLSKKRVGFFESLARTRSRAVARNWRKLRNNSRFGAIVHGSFDTAHNLKVVGSNPATATKKLNSINALRQLDRGAFPCPRDGSTIGQQDRASCDAGLETALGYAPTATITDVVRSV